MKKSKFKFLKMPSVPKASSRKRGILGGILNKVVNRGVGYAIKRSKSLPKIPKTTPHRQAKMFGGSKLI